MTADNLIVSKKENKHVIISNTATFQSFQDLKMSAIPRALKLGRLTYFDMPLLVMGINSLVEEITFMLIIATQGLKEQFTGDLG